MVSDMEFILANYPVNINRFTAKTNGTRADNSFLIIIGFSLNLKETTDCSDHTARGIPILQMGKWICPMRNTKAENLSLES